MFDYEYEELKPYKGYGISKAYKVDDEGNRVSGTTVYLVDDGEDYIGEEFKSIKEAHKFVEEMEA